MKRTLQICRAIVVAGTLEGIRRKDLYMVMVLTLVLVLGAYSFSFFGVSGLGMFVKDMGFTCVGLFSTIVAVLISARQVPEEIQRRTIYPMLARPITRWQFLLAKFFTAWTNSIVVFLSLVLVTSSLLLLLRINLTPIFFQYVFLKCLSFSWLCGFTMFLATVASQHAAATLAILLALGSSAFDRVFVMAHGVGSSMNPIEHILYAMLPHFTLFDLTQKMVYEWPPIPLTTVLFLVVYAVLIGPIWLMLAWLKLRRQAV